MIIKNREELATTELRRAVLDIIEAGIARVLPPAIMKSAVSYDPARRVIRIQDYTHRLSEGRVFVIGGGKAAGLMAETLEAIITPENIPAGIVTCNCRSSDYKTRKIKIVEAGHPVPDERGLDGVKQMLALKDSYGISRKDLVICLVSGGASALMPGPAEGISLGDKRRITELLLSCGAEIHEINAVRKHLSRTKGGRLGFYYAPASVVSLVLSDVIGNDLDVIGSGLTCPDTSTFQDAYNVLAKYQLLERVPEGVRSLFETGRRGALAETPKALNNCLNYIIGDNALALEAMAVRARETGFKPHIVTAEQKGDTASVACLRAQEILEGVYSGDDMVLIGGETTPRLPPHAGKGGRNQHYAAVSMLAMQDYPGKWVVASAGTDGSDFLPGVAGAMVDNGSLGKARGMQLDVEGYLERYDSHTLLQKLGQSLILTGNTGTNVGDVIVYALKQ